MSVIFFFFLFFFLMIRRPPRSTLSSSSAASDVYKRQDQNYTYFVHSYYAVCPTDEIVATVQHGVTVPSIVQRDNVVGMQFHPEKSGQVGLQQLATFKDMVSANDFSSN
ncbi:imidazole glycerol phosphate synthase subunit HisH [Lactobacillus pentosus] [Lactiplantibacillus mudanjiangensis]|nr:imidazole glycerol phosphate synthase subunit HisH [Lactobacillus pentosus] [Lactiplantibacillus mudanjiangensis]